MAKVMFGERPFSEKIFIPILEQTQFLIGHAFLNTE